MVHSYHHIDKSSLVGFSWYWIVRAAIKLLIGEAVEETEVPIMIDLLVVQAILEALLITIEILAGEVA